MLIVIPVVWELIFIQLLVPALSYGAKLGFDPYGYQLPPLPLKSSFTVVCECVCPGSVITEVEVWLCVCVAWFCDVFNEGPLYEPCVPVPRKKHLYNQVN